MKKTGIIVTAIACLWSAVANAETVLATWADQYIRGDAVIGPKPFALAVPCNGDWRQIIAVGACNCDIDVSGLPASQYRVVNGLQVRGSAASSSHSFKATLTHHFPSAQLWSQPQANAIQQTMTGTLETVCQKEGNP